MKKTLKIHQKCSSEISGKNKKRKDVESGKNSQTTKASGTLSSNVSDFRKSSLSSATRPHSLGFININTSRDSDRS